jgi:hypothetical protein
MRITNDRGDVLIMVMILVAISATLLLAGSTLAFNAVRLYRHNAAVMSATEAANQITNIINTQNVCAQTFGGLPYNSTKLNVTNIQTAPGKTAFSSDTSSATNQISYGSSFDEIYFVEDVAAPPAPSDKLTQYDPDTTTTTTYSVHNGHFYMRFIGAASGTIGRSIPMTMLVDAGNVVQKCFVSNSVQELCMRSGGNISDNFGCVIPKMGTIQVAVSCPGLILLGMTKNADGSLTPVCGPLPSN